MCTDLIREDLKDLRSSRLLQNPADMYEMGEWAMREYERYPYTRHQFKVLGREIIRLWMSLCHAEAAEKCFEFECESVATSMTFASADCGWSPMPWFWCNQHGPKDPDVNSPKMLISMDEVRQFRTKRDRRRFTKELRRVLGIPSGTRITGQFARNWFRDHTKMSADLLTHW